MEIILRKDLAKLGHKDEIVNVKNGYGRNFLIPQGHAILATPSAKKIHEEVVRQRAHKEEKMRNEATAMAQKLESLVLKIGTKISSTGKIFGSVNNIQISEAIQKLGYEVDRKNITLNSANIKEIGIFNAKVKLYKDINVEIKFEVIAE